MTHSLPIALENEPLIEAVFEIRFSETTILPDILPGVLFHELEPKPIISRLPAAEIPQPMRINDPALRFAPTQRLEWGQFLISIGSGNIVISCKLPYPKWPSFREVILDILLRVERVGIAEKVDRYAVKYVNLIQGKDISEQLGKIQLKIELGDITVDQDQLSLQIHHKEENIFHILSIITGASTSLQNGDQLNGVIVDIDSIREIGGVPFSGFVDNFKNNLEELRQSNKGKFFGCLTEETLSSLGPIYE